MLEHLSRTARDGKRAGGVADWRVTFDYLTNKVTIEVDLESKEHAQQLTDEFAARLRGDNAPD